MTSLRQIHLKERGHRPAPPPKLPPRVPEPVNRAAIRRRRPSAKSLMSAHRAALERFGADAAAMQRALTAASRTTGVPIEDIVGQRRTTDVVAARQLAMLIMLQRLRSTKTAIGLVLGGRDHSTVSNGVEKARDRVLSDRAWTARWRAALNTMRALERSGPDLGTPASSELLNVEGRSRA